MPLLDPDFLPLTASLDLPAFWDENARCAGFTAEKPRCAVAFALDEHWLFEFLGVPSTLHYYRDKPYRDALHAEANRWLVAYVGRAYFDEDTWESAPRRIENLFGCEYSYTEGSTPWLTPATRDPRAFDRILDAAERVDAAAWAFPEDFLCEWEARKSAGKPLPALGGGSRGPATIMTSVLHAEDLFLWYYDDPGRIRRFRDVLAAQMIAFNRALRAFSGNTTPGWWITDDNSALFNRRLYRDLCCPVLEQVMDALAPPPSRRYQHSDSAMAHLLDMQYGLGIRAVNYGPTIPAAQIRAAMPDAFIHGQVPPFLLRSGAPEAIRARVREDFAGAGAGGGLEITTAGSLAAGTGLGRMRWLMRCVEEETRYG
jgi:hypothetical protein